MNKTDTFGITETPRSNKSPRNLAKRATNQTISEGLSSRAGTGIDNSVDN